MKFLKKMNKVPRRIIKSVFWTVVSIVTLIIFLMIWLHFFFPNTYVKNLLEKELSKSFGRKIKISSLNVSLFTGIKIKNFEIFEGSSRNRNIRLSGGSLFVKAGKVDLSYRIFPLLWKKLVVKKAVITRPEIHVTRYKNGNFNFSDIINKLTVPATPATGPPQRSNALRINNPNTGYYPILANISSILAQTARKKKEDSSSFGMQVNKVGFKNAVITFTDYKNEIVPAVYTIDKLSFMLSDINSENYKKPAKILFTFQVSMKRLEGSRVQRKMFNLFTSVSGDIFLFDKKGNILAQPAVNLRIDLKDGLLSGTQIQKVLNNILENLKKKFFREYAKQLLDIVGNFDKKLKVAANKFLKKYSGKLTSFIDKLRGKRNTSVTGMKTEKKSVASVYKKKALDVVKKIENANKKFLNSANKILRVFSLIPGNKKQAKKLKKKLKAFSNKLKKQTAMARTRMTKKSSGGMGSDIDRYIAKVKKKFDDAIKKISSTFNKMVDKYVKAIQKKVHKKLKGIIKKIDKFKLNLPFLKKELKMKHGYFFVSYANGVVTVSKLKIGADNYNVDAKKVVINTNNNRINGRIDFHIDKKYNKNIFTNFFADEGNDVDVPVQVRGTTSDPDVSLVGINLKDKMKKFGVKLGAQLAKKYLGLNIPVDSILAGSSGPPTDYKAEFKKILKKYLNKLIHEQGIHNKFINKFFSRFKKDAKKKRKRPRIRSLRRRFGL